MFTGIIKDIGKVKSIKKSVEARPIQLGPIGQTRLRSAKKSGDTRIESSTNFNTNSIEKGASICCSGVCLTVIDIGSSWFAVEVSRETLSKTVLSSWKLETMVNLERSLKIGDELGGHIVSGHVDGVAHVKDIFREGDSLRVWLKTEKKLIRFIAPKCSVALNGVSLTVNEVENHNFGINVISYTQEETTLGKISIGDTLNLEIDMLARYVARLVETENS